MTTGTVLIVDDDPGARDALEALLFREGYNLEFAESGLLALEKLKSLTPDVILLDVMMPGMDGFETCARIRQTPHLAEIPVILVTALDDRDSRLRGLEAGADDFTTKPYDRAELRTRVRTIMKLNRYRRLVAERERFEWVVEHTEDGYVLIGENDTIMYANPAARVFLNLGQDDNATFQKTAQKAYHCEPEPIWAQYPNIPTDAELFLVRPATETENALWLQVYHRSADAHREAKYLVRIRDVTTEKVNQRLMWSFRTQVSHKLRTPLTLMMGSLQLFDERSREYLPDDMKEMFDYAWKGATRLQRELQDILLYINRTDLVNPSDGFFLVMDVEPLATNLAEMVGIQSFTFKMHNIDQPDGTYLAVAERALSIILNELFNNAYKFHPQNNPKIDVSLTKTGEVFHLQVKDDGIRLPPNELPKIWQPYYQVEKNFSGQVPGVGLGLATVSSLVWSIGGTCQAYNRNDKPGLIVEIVLPESVFDDTAW